MKKLLLIITLLLGAVSVQAQPLQTLEEIAKSYNKNCPKPAGDGLTLNQVEATDSAFVFLYGIEDDMYKNIERLGGILHDSTIAEMVSSPNESTQQLIAICRQNKINILIKLMNSEGKSFDITILPEEL